MSSTYNAVPRPAAVLVADGEVAVIRRRETIDDLLALEPTRLAAVYATTAGRPGVLSLRVSRRRGCGRRPR